MNDVVFQKSLGRLPRYTHVKWAWTTDSSGNPCQLPRSLAYLFTRKPYLLSICKILAIYRALLKTRGIIRLISCSQTVPSEFLDVE